MTYGPRRDPERLIRAGLRRVQAYEPIRPLESLSELTGIPAERLVKLDGNENPYGCSPVVRRALAGYPFFHIYPDPLQRELEGPLEEYAGIGREHIVAGSGSDELIDLVLRMFLEPGDRVINFPPTFGMYPFSTAVCGGETVTVPRDAGYNVDAAAVRRAVDDRTKVIFIASPNNPTGNVTGQETLLELLDTGVVVVVDEAYYEFSGRTFVPLVRERPNLIVLRTFSKWAGLGGLRAGYGIFPAGIAELIRRIKLPYNVNVAAIIAMRESLADVEYLRGNIRAIVRERERLVSLLREQGVLDPLPSEANFVLCRVKTADALEIKQELDRQGIFIRHFCMPSTEDMLRISVGKPEHTDALLGALARWQGGKYGK